MLRYIYLFVFLFYFQLVFCYSSVHKEMRPRHRRRQEVAKVYRSSRSPLAHIDMIGFMQKPESMSFDPYNYDNRRLSNLDYLPPGAPAARRRRARHQTAGAGAPDASHTTRFHHRLYPHHLVHHPKRKCSFALFPFFSHKTKNKTKPGSPKHERKSAFSKAKDYKSAGTDKREQKAKQDIPMAESKMETPIKAMQSKCKMKDPQKIHNSRIYYANPYRINNDGDVLGFRIDRGDK